MKTLKTIGIALLAIIALFAGIGLLLPREVEVSRSVVVDAPKPVVFAHVNDLEKFVAWNPWAAEDPEMQVSYGDKRSGEGASYSWNGPVTGEGEMTNREVVAHEKIVQELSFGAQGGGVATWTFREVDSGIEAEWHFSTDLGYNPVQRWFGLIIPGMIGEKYEAGLQNMKAMAEGESETATETDS